MTTIRHSAAFLLAATLLQSCAASSPAPVEPRESATAAAQIAGTVRCPSAAQVPSSWKTVTDETGAFALRLPPSLQPAPKDKFFFVHGGQTWEDENMTVSLRFGQWAEYSFQDQPGERCRLAVGESDVFLIVGPSSITAWYDRGSGGHEPVLSISMKNGAEIQPLTAIALSLRRTEAPR